MKVAMILIGSSLHNDAGDERLQGLADAEEQRCLQGSSGHCHFGARVWLNDR